MVSSAAIRCVTSTLLTLMTLTLTSGVEFELRYSVVEEQASAGYVIADIARDSGIRELSQASDAVKPLFTLLSPLRLPLRLDNHTGLLTVISRLDREDYCAGKDSCTEVLRVFSIQPGALFQMIRVAIEVVDINDNAPRSAK